MTTGWKEIQSQLNRVSKPGRYTGAEFNVQLKEWNATQLKVALAFPDIYEIGMSHLGLRILYELINTQPDMLAERVFAPWPDFQALLKEQEARLFSLENKKPLSEFDIIGFSLQYELSYTNVLTMLELGGIPLWSKDRDESQPLVIGGGPCAFNPEPMADFFDFIFIGEAENVLISVLEKVRDWKIVGAPKSVLLKELATIEGVYVPSHFRVEYHEDGRISAITSLQPEQPSRAVVRNYSQIDFPNKWLVPYMDIVHDRVAFEIQRGCTKGCRFCQAGMIYRPVREKDPADIMAALQKLMADTGYEEFSLTSLSSADYTEIERLITEACGCFTPQRINVSLPSLRVDSFSVDLAAKFQGSRKGSLTFAPEAGTDRLRRVINKGVTSEDLRNAVNAAFKSGWQKLKLYFMIGLPTETEQDIAGIVDLAQQVVQIGKSFPRSNSLRITVSASTFVPKAHTPFQWRSQISVEETIAKQTYLQEKLRGRSLELNWHDPKVSQLEGVLARGDRRLSQVIYQAWREGAQFDGWSEHFKYSLWMDALQTCGLNSDFYTRARDYDEILPWSHLKTGIDTDFLKQENQRAEQEITTLDCRKEQCSACGVCSQLKVGKRMAGDNRA